MTSAPRLNDVFDPRRNSIGAMRFICAVLVIVGHSVPFGGYGIDPLIVLTNNQTAIGRWPVDVFFVLSGFLLAMSFGRSSLSGYTLNRFLRIYPAYWVCLLICGIVVPVAFSADIDWAFVARGIPLIFYVRQEIPGVFDSNPISSINGVLWTLPIELACYVSLPLMAWLGLLTKSRALVVFAFGYIAFCIQIAMNAQLVELHPALNSITSPLRLGTFFYAGVIMWLWRDRIVISPVWAFCAVSGLVLSIVIGNQIYNRQMGVFYMVAPFLLSYITVYLAVQLGWTRFNAKTDLSYGIYIYGTLILQILTASGLAVGTLPLLAYLGIASGLTLLAASASWFFIEKPALSLKRR